MAERSPSDGARHRPARLPATAAPSLVIVFAAFLAALIIDWKKQALQFIRALAFALLLAAAAAGMISGAGSTRNRGGGGSITFR